MLKQNKTAEENPRERSAASHFELIDFTLNRTLPNGRKVVGTYGVNVVKVREVIHMPVINPLASNVPGIEGIFELRGVPIPAVNLCTILGDREAPLNKDDQIIVTEFSHKRAGFIVHSTNRIRRVTWDKILPPSTDRISSMTGMMLIENNEFLFILDLERIIANLESQAYGRSSSSLTGVVETSSDLTTIALPPKRAGYPSILVVDDSSLILSNMSRILNQEGFGVVLARNGLEGLQRLEEAQTGSFKIDGIITDLEMPQMDGLSFLRRVRQDPQYSTLPMYLHSSLNDASSQQRAAKDGANGFFVKNEIATIIQTLKAQFLSRKITA